MAASSETDATKSTLNVTTASEADLVERLGDVLARVKGGERLAIERNGQVVAILVPPEPKPQFAYGDFIALMNHLPWPDEDFGNHLAETQAAQQPARMPA